MKRWGIRLVAFFATFAIGGLLVWTFIAPSPTLGEPDPNGVRAIVVNDALASPQPPVVDDFEPEFRDLPNITERNWDFKVKLIDVFESANVYRRDDLKVKPGQNWFGLFGENGKYSLKLTKVWVQNAPDDSGYDDDPVQLKFSEPGLPIFMVRNAEWAKPRSVPTVYHRPSSDEIQSRNLQLKSVADGYNEHFELNGKHIYLRVSYGLTVDGTKVAVLVIKSGTQSQIVRTQEYWKDGNIFGELFWIGDIDGDGEIDFYLDAFNEIGAFVPSLYLSSAANEGNLVKEIAIFVRPGC